jgi:hypothetical protein
VKTMMGTPVLLLAAGLVMAGCLTPAPKADGPCWSCNDQRMVRVAAVEGQAISSHGPSSPHPLSLDMKSWEAVLRSLRVRSIHRPLLGPSFNGSEEAAFNEEEIQYLAEALARAFKEMTADQRAVFALARVSDTGAPHITSGAWFAEQGRIHLQLANYQVAVTMPSIRKRIWMDPLFAQGERFYEVVPTDHQEIVKSTQKRGGLFRPDPLELAIDYTFLIKQGSEPSQSPASSEKSPSQPASQPIEDRMGQLKRLYDQGLITEEDYRLKKQQLLDQL